MSSPQETWRQVLAALSERGTAASPSGHQRLLERLAALSYPIQGLRSEVCGAAGASTNVCARGRD